MTDPLVFSVRLAAGILIVGLASLVVASLWMALFVAVARLWERCLSQSVATREALARHTGVRTPRKES